jgi:hypothetical protein
MKQFANEYPHFPFLQVPLAKIKEVPILQARLANFTISADGEFVQVPLAQITWYHHISMIPKVKDYKEYCNLMIQYEWEFKNIFR